MAYMPDFSRLGFSIKLLSVDIKQAVHFYEAAFGFEVVNDLHANCSNNTRYIEMKLDKTIILLYDNQKSTDNSNKKNTSTRAEDSYKRKEIIAPVLMDIERLYLRATANSALSITEPRKNINNEDYCVLQDYFGYKWVFVKQS